MEKWTRILYQPDRPLGQDGKRVTACAEHIALSQNAAKEGMVLLKNEHKLLPFAKGTRLALFGKGTFDYVKGGGGSGDVTVAYTTNLYEGLKKLNGHVGVFEKLADYYYGYVREQYASGKEPGMIAEPQIPDELLEEARAYTDTAVISISRFSGEAWDRGGKGQELFEKGDFYLSNAEMAMVEKIKNHFPKIVVVMNVGGMVDTEWFCREDAISSVLMAWQGGMEGGSAAAELLCGLGNPCGKLSDTFAKLLEDYPSTAGFHESDDYVDYTEDIYVGYRYFETIPGAAERVNYPFGYGLSYTDFEWDVLSVKQIGESISVLVDVQNIGGYPGKEVIQLYASAPQGELGKAARSLVAFQKTDLLRPGENQVVTLEFPIASMASYDDLGRIKKSAYVLEKGDYCFYAGTSVRHTAKLDYIYTVTEDIVTAQLSPKIVPRELKRRLRSDGIYEELPQLEPADPNFSELEPQPEHEKRVASPAIRAVPSISGTSYTDKKAHELIDVAQGRISLDEFVAQLSDEDLMYLLGGQPCTGVADTCGFGNLPEFGVPNAMTADGPAGLRVVPRAGVNTTAFPCATLLACTWNPQICFVVGATGAKEVKENNIAAWLTPAVNIHRSPLCGRNFEYYSEDPLLTGVLASAMVKGIQSQNIAPSVKHFALNNKETNRKNSDSRVSERAAREIYLKAFEIIVKTAHPWYIMSSYNIINGCRTSENRELLEDILRGEWGFDGVVSSDWWTLGEHYKEVKAGNDLKMPAGFPGRLAQALAKGLITRRDLERSAKRILTLLLRVE